MLTAIAWAYARGYPNDFDSALRGVEDALKVAAEERSRGALPSNVDDAVTQVMARVDSLNEDGRFTDARAALETARRDRQDAVAREQSGLMRVLDKTVVQVRLANDPELTA